MNASNYQKAARAWSVRVASITDAPEIAQIAFDQALTQKTADSLANEGFLVSGYSASQYERWASNILVGEYNGRVGAFLLSFRRNEIPSELQDAERLFEAAGDDDFLLIKQVAVQSEVMGTGGGKALYHYRLRACHGIPVFAAILLEPRNDRSIAFHAAMGFIRFADFAGPDGRPRAFWRYSSSR